MLTVLIAITAATSLFTNAPASAQHGSGSVVQQHWELLSETHLGLLGPTTIPIHRGVVPGGTSKFDPAPTATFVIVARASTGLGHWEVQLRDAVGDVLAEIILWETAITSEYQTFTAPLAWSSIDRELADIFAWRGGTKILDIKKAYLKIEQQGTIKKTVARMPIATRQNTITSGSWTDVTDAIFYRHGAEAFDPAPTIMLRTTGRVNQDCGQLQTRLVDSSGIPVIGGNSGDTKHYGTAWTSFQVGFYPLEDLATYHLQVRVKNGLFCFTPPVGDLLSADLIFEQSTGDAHGITSTVGFYPSVSSPIEVAMGGSPLDFLLKAPTNDVHAEAAFLDVSMRRASGSGEAGVRLVNAGTGEPLATAMTSSTGWVYLNAPVPILPGSTADLDTSTILSADTSGRISQTVVRVILLLRDLLPPVLNLQATQLAFSPNGDGVNDTTTISFVASDESPPIDWSIEVRNLADLVVRNWSGTSGSGEDVSISWDGTGASGQTVADGHYTVRVTALDQVGNSQVQSIQVTIDTVSPIFDPRTLSPPDFGQTFLPSITLAIRVEDAGLAGINPASVIFQLTDLTNNTTTTYTGPDVSFSQGWAKTTPVALEVGHSYRLHGIASDFAGNTASYAQVPADQGGGFLASSATVSQPSASITPTPCTVSSTANTETGTRTATCPNVRIITDPVSVSIASAKRNGVGYVREVISLNNTLVKTMIGGEEFSTNAYSPTDPAWTFRQFYSAFAAEANPNSQNLIASALDVDIGTLTAQVPEDWTEAFLELTPTPTDVGIAACVDPSAASQFCSADPLDHGYIVVLNPTVADPEAVAQEHFASFGVDVRHIYREAIEGYSGNLSPAAILSVAADSRVQFIARDRILRTAADAIPTGVARIKADRPPSSPNLGEGVHVAVLDTGINRFHPDLAGNGPDSSGNPDPNGNVAGGVNCTGDAPATDYQDLNPSSHGTAVSGVIAAMMDGQGVVGVAPKAKLWAVKVVGGNTVINTINFVPRQVGLDSLLLCGIDFIYPRSQGLGGPISVANISLYGGTTADDNNCGIDRRDAVHLAMCKTTSDGQVTFVVAAGNLSESYENTYPAQYDEVITVTNFADSDGESCGVGSSLGDWNHRIDEAQLVPDDTFAVSSNYAAPEDLHHTVAAPGVGILTTSGGGGWAAVSGTSFSSPHAAGVAALFIGNHMAQNGGQRPTQEQVRLFFTTAASQPPSMEPKDVNYSGECGVSPISPSHRDVPSDDPLDPFAGRLFHPEPVVRADSL